EMDPRPLMLALAAGGHVLALPVTPPRGQPLAFRAWAPGAALRAGPMGTSEPISGDELRPDILLVPLLAFDRAGRPGAKGERLAARWRHWQGQAMPACGQGEHEGARVHLLAHWPIAGDDGARCWGVVGQ
ncbi:MAG: 5-formyltetrahydrofolate cyclo-ligase, partial [Alphaproteobacteria bacterium]